MYWIISYIVSGVILAAFLYNNGAYERAVEKALSNPEQKQLLKDHNVNLRERKYFWYFNAVVVIFWWIMLIVLAVNTGKN